MKLDAVRAIADAVLYEGYLLYPYRASAAKNRSRWQFGVLMSGDYAVADPSERSFLQAECVFEGDANSAVTVVLRFLQVQDRTVERWAGERFVATDALTVDDTTMIPWEEGVEREIAVAVPTMPYEHGFQLDAAVHAEPIHDRQGVLVGQVVRRHRALCGTVTVSARPVPGPWGAFRLRVRVENRTPLGPTRDRAAALSSALVASHVVVGVRGGALLSMVDHPEWAASAVADCENVGVWPVLVGPPGRRDLMLCAPIILYDHPEIAPESSGDLFDATEIDEILTLRTRALSAAEKREARATDPRAAAVIDRVDGLADAQLRRLHGAMRAPRPVPEEETVVVDGRELRGGSRVRLRPGGRRTDAQDMFLAGRVAVVEVVLRDLEDKAYLAVTLVDDPGAELSRSHGRFRYFAPDEVEPCDA